MYVFKGILFFYAFDFTGRDLDLGVVGFSLGLAVLGWSLSWSWSRPHIAGLPLNLGPKHGCIIKIFLDTVLTTDVNKYSLASAIDANKDGGSN